VFLAHGQVLLPADGLRAEGSQRTSALDVATLGFADQRLLDAWSGGDSDDEVGWSLNQVHVYNQKKKKDKKEGFEDCL